MNPVPTKLQTLSPDLGVSIGFISSSPQRKCSVTFPSLRCRRPESLLLGLLLILFPLLLLALPLVLGRLRVVVLLPREAVTALALNLLGLVRHADAVLAVADPNVGGVLDARVFAHLPLIFDYGAHFLSSGRGRGLVCRLRCVRLKLADVQVVVLVA